MSIMVDKVRAVPDWRHQAACLDEDPDLFFPIGNTGPAVFQIKEAKEVCRRCDVVQTCRRWALDHSREAAAGVWGGLSEVELRAVRRREARTRRAAG
jgi:WhiB family redox-sensing transcriptional regulator